MTRYVTLAEYVWLAEQVTGIDATVLVKASRIDLADSALHAPAAGFGDDDFYPDLFDKAEVLMCCLSWNHARWQPARLVGCTRHVHRSQQRHLGTRSTRCRRCRSCNDRHRRETHRRGPCRRVAPNRVTFADH